MTKVEFEKKVEEYICKLISINNEIDLIDVFKKQNLARLSHPILNKIEVTSLCDFVCDFVFLAKHRSGGYELILVNRYVKSVGLRDIGEMLVYAKMANPYKAFLISTSGHSTEINNILVDESISKPLFNYGNNKNIILFALDDGIKRESVLPVYAREQFYKEID